MLSSLGGVADGNVVTWSDGAGRTGSGIWTISGIRESRYASLAIRFQY